MSKLTKRLTAMLLAGMLTIGLVSGSAFAADVQVDPGVESGVVVEEASSEEVTEESESPAENASREESSETTVTWAEISYEKVAGVRGVYTAYLSFDASEYLLKQQVSFDYYDTIGVLQGIISYNSDYISLISVEKNEWACKWMQTYDSDYGEFMTVKSDGAYSASPLKITYKIIKACPYGAELIQVKDIIFLSTRLNKYIQSAPLSLVIKTDHCEEHAYDDREIITPASCTGDGLCKKSCVDCEDTISEVIPATGHKWHAEYTIDKEASCTEEGSESIHCSVCDEVDESTVRVIPKKEHAYGDEKITLQASCTEAGIKEKICADCGNKTTVVIPATGHKWNEEYTVDKEASCTEEGSESIHCSVCDEVDGSTVRVIPQKEHVYADWIITKQTSCIEAGSKEKLCIDCGNKIIDAIPATGHKWNEEYTIDKEASCTEEGSESIHCSVCDEVDESTVCVIPKKEHSYIDGKITKQASCTEAGSREKICADCGDKVTEDIPPTGHKWNEEYTVDKEATYTEEGSESIHCSVCGEIKEGSSKAIAKLRKPVSMLDITGIETKTYSGSELTQTIVVKDGASILEEDIDYTVSYSNNVNAGTATVTITGIGNYTGTIRKNFTINKADQSITAKSSASTIAVGKTATVSITGAKGTKSFKSSDTAIATVTSAGKVTAKKVGTVKITVTSAATANYKAASKTVTIKVVPAATASLTASNLATGIKLNWKKVTGATGYKVYRGSTLLKTITSGSTVTYTDTKANTNGTKYTYKIVAKAATGDSTLPKSLITYRVARTAISSAANSAAGKMTVKWAKNAKATGYYVQYSLDKTFETGNKLVNISSASTVSKTITNLTKGNTYYVRVRTYKTVGSTKYWSAWSMAKTVKISK